MFETVLKIAATLTLVGFIGIITYFVPEIPLILIGLFSIGLCFYDLFMSAASNKTA